MKKSKERLNAKEQFAKALVTGERLGVTVLPGTDELSRPAKDQFIEKLKKSPYKQLTMEEFNSLEWGVDCKFGIACLRTKKLLHSSDSEVFITGVYNKLRDPKNIGARRVYGGFNTDIQMVTR